VISTRGLRPGRRQGAKYKQIWRAGQRPWTDRGGRTARLTSQAADVRACAEIAWQGPAIRVWR